jgi:hypothetical protein
MNQIPNAAIREGSDGIGLASGICNDLIGGISYCKHLISDDYKPQHGLFGFPVTALHGWSARLLWHLCDLVCTFMFSSSYSTRTDRARTSARQAEQLLSRFPFHCNTLLCGPAPSWE